MVCTAATCLLQSQDDARRRTFSRRGLSFSSIDDTLCVYVFAYNSTNLIILPSLPQDGSIHDRLRKEHDAQEDC